MQDIAQALSNSLSRDGNGGMRAPLDVGGFRVTNLAPGTNPTDAATVGQSGIPVGTPMFWLMEVPPDDSWIMAFGQAVSRTEYSTLFSRWGTRFGAGDGATTFNMPDCRGVVFGGLDNMGGTAADRLTGLDTVGKIIGSQAITLTAGQMPTHTHTLGSAGAHTHDVTAPVVGTGGFDQPNVPKWTARTDSNFGNRTITTSSAGAHTHTVNNAGQGQSHPNVQPTFGMYIIIKAKVA